MSKLFKRVLSVLLVVTLLLTANMSVFAAESEEYLSDLRLVYAKTYSEAQKLVAQSGLEGYEVLDENLNESTGETGVWLVYKTTTEVDDAITDITTMQMNGGYSEGNYQEMIKKSYEEYLKMGETYLEAIDYFIEAYDEGDFLAESAYRQLNFYTVETEGDTQQKKHSFEGELLGDIFYNGIEVSDLAILFLQGNSYALKNIRSLLAMGVSWNEDEMTYMEKVAEAAEEMRDDPEVFNGEDFSDLLPNISSLLVYLRSAFENLETIEDEFDWEDNEFTQDEINNSEITFIATLMRDVEYLDGKTLYEFCMDYEEDDADDPELYPLAAALNPGQAAMTKVLHYYDVLRYSVTDLPPDLIEEQLAESEEKYSENPFNVYAGVDRSVYDGTFALTTAADRANTMNEYSLEETLFGEAASLHTKIATGVGIAGVGITIFALCRTIYYKNVIVDAQRNAVEASVSAMRSVFDNVTKAVDDLQYQQFVGTGAYNPMSYGRRVDQLLYQYDLNVDLNTTSFADKLDILEDWRRSAKKLSSTSERDLIDSQSILNQRTEVIDDTYAFNGDDRITSYNKALYGGGNALTAALYVFGGAMMLYSAITMGITVYNYYNPDYDDIPTSMVDLLDTTDGDRYIKYDVVYEAKAAKDGSLIAGDLNAFEAQRWNALYYTKSYEAGKPLLADFIVSYSSNVPTKKYAPVRRFGEMVCYDLNKYNFNYDNTIYLSVRQSDNQKSAVADVPPIIGSIFSSGLWVLFGSAGALIGVGGTLGTQALLKKKRAKTTK